MKKYNKKDLVGTFFVSKKLDGIFAHWDGNNLLTRNDKIITSCPQVNAKLLNSGPVSGELYNRLICFERINGAARSKLPTTDSLSLRFYDHSKLRQIKMENPSFLQLEYLMKKYVRMKYEGIVIKDEHGNMLKYKPRQDAEFSLIGFEAAKTDRNRDTFGSLILSLGSGLTFKCSGITDTQRVELWSKKPIGKMIKVSFDGMTKNGIPRFPSYECVRWDI